MRAYGVPWGTNISCLSLHKTLTIDASTKGIVSSLHLLFLEASYKTLPILDIWYRDLYGTDTEDSIDNICWDSIWANLKLGSKNPNHQLIHYKMVHMMYLSPRKRYLMKLSSSSNCNFCSGNSIGTYRHMFWDCPKVNHFWKQVSKTLKDILEVDISCCPKFLLLNGLIFQFLSVSEFFFILWINCS